MFNIKKLMQCIGSALKQPSCKLQGRFQYFRYIMWTLVYIKRYKSNGAMHKVKIKIRLTFAEDSFDQFAHCIAKWHHLRILKKNFCVHALTLIVLKTNSFERHYVGGTLNVWWYARCTRAQMCGILGKYSILCRINSNSN